MLQIQAQFVADTGAVCCKYRRSLLQIQAQFVANTGAVCSSSPYAFVIVARPPPNRIASAVRSDSVRRPIRFRPPSVGGYGILPYPRSPHRGCSGLRCTNKAVNKAPSNHQPSNQAINHQPTKHPTKPPNHLILPIKSSHISNKNTNFANP